MLGKRVASRQAAYWLLPTAYRSWLRLAALLVVAAASELVYASFWPISYYLTQASDYTYEYLTEYPAVWERLLPMLVRFEATWPGGSQSLEFLVDALMRLFIGAFCLYLVAFLLVRAGLPKGWGTAGVLGPAIAFQVTLFLMPGLFTTDMFSYVVYGDIAGAYGLNPYLQVPAFFPESRASQWIHPIWHYAASIYGPAWINLSWFIARAVAQASDVDKVLAYKLAVNLSHLAGIACLALAVRAFRPSGVLPSVLLYAWNPLIVFEFGGNGHNDALMVAIMLLAVVLFASRCRLLGLGALTISFLIKMSSVLLLPYYVMAWARERAARHSGPRSAAAFSLVVAAAGLTVAAITAGLYLPWWVGVDTLDPIILWSQGPPLYNNSVPDIVAQRAAFEYLLGPTAPDPEAALDLARAWVKLISRVAFASYCAWELLQARGQLGMVGSAARVMLGFLLVVNTWVLPWYFSWPLALAIVLGWQRPLTWVLLGFSLSAPTVMYYHHFWHPYMSDSTYLLYLAPLAVPLLMTAPRVAAWLGHAVAAQARARPMLRRYGSVSGTPQAADSEP
ncbi:MAG TPA: hypothetical protein VEQ11_06090 [Chloroflexota bacterium]|nr:hypothetical protein [Chloroflexota bacterium]